MLMMSMLSTYDAVSVNYKVLKVGLKLVYSLIVISRYGVQYGILYWEKNVRVFISRAKTLTRRNFAT